MLSNVDRRDPRVRRTHQLLQQAFLDLLMIKSFEDLTVKDITERAMVNRATFYAHFDDKYALLNATIQASFMQCLQRRLPAGTFVELKDLEQVVLAVCDFLCQFDGACRRMERRFEVLVEREVKALIVDLLRTWFVNIHMHRSSAEVTTDLPAIMASWAIYGAALHWSHQQPRQPVDLFARTVVPLIFEGVMRGSIESRAKND